MPSTTLAPVGTWTSAPTATMRPRSTSTVPFSITGPETVTTRAPRIASGASCAAPGDRSARQPSARTTAQRLHWAPPATSGAHSGDRPPGLQVLGAVEVDLPVDERHLAARERRERVGAPDRDVGLLARLERAHVLVDPELPRRVPGDHLERLRLAHAAVLDRLRGVPVEPARELVRVGVERDLDALAREDRRVVGDGAHRLHLERPPVDEGPHARAVARDLARDLVRLEPVLEGAHLEAELVGDRHQHQHLVGAVAVRVDVDLAVEDVGERLEPAGRGAAARACRPWRAGALSFASYSAHSFL